MSSQDNDQDMRVVAVVLISAILLAVGLALGMGVHKARSGAGAGDGAHAVAAVAGVSAAASVTADAAAAMAAGGQSSPSTLVGVTTADDASIVVENGVVKFYFAVGKADMAPGAVEALTDAIDAAKAGRKLALSGYHDATGNAAMNAELAKRRAMAVRDVLIGAGVDAAMIELRKPEESTGTGHAAEARRVEVLIID